MTIQRRIIAATRPARYVLGSLLFKTFANTELLVAQRNRFCGEAMLVVGNGPSLNHTPLDDFLGVPAIGMNKIDLIYPRTRWRPSLVVCLNNVVAQQHQDYFASSDIPVFVAWNARWLIRSENRDKLAYFNTTLSSRFSTNALHGFGSSATVTYVALQMAYWMGANPVILFGVDHSFKYSGPASTYQKREGPDVNHFDPNYFKSGTFWGTPDLGQSEIDYGRARDAFKAAERKVYDATIDGKLEVFEKISVERARELVEANPSPR
jgi:hypothetical protein